MALSSLLSPLSSLLSPPSSFLPPLSSLLFLQAYLTFLRERDALMAREGDKKHAPPSRRMVDYDSESDKEESAVQGGGRGEEERVEGETTRDGWSGEGGGMARESTRRVAWSMELEELKQQVSILSDRLEGPRQPNSPPSNREATTVVASPSLPCLLQVSKSSAVNRHFSPVREKSRGVGWGHSESPPPDPCMDPDPMDPEPTSRTGEHHAPPPPLRHPMTIHHTDVASPATAEPTPPRASSFLPRPAQPSPWRPAPEPLQQQQQAAGAEPVILEPGEPVSLSPPVSPPVSPLAVSPLGGVMMPAGGHERGPSPMMMMQADRAGDPPSHHHALQPMIPPLPVAMAPVAGDTLPPYPYHRHREAERLSLSSHRSNRSNTSYTSSIDDTSSSTTTVAEMEVGSAAGRVARQEKLIRKLKKRGEEQSFTLREALSAKEATERRLEVYKIAANAMPKLQRDLDGLTASLERSEMIRKSQKDKIAQLEARLEDQERPASCGKQVKPEGGKPVAGGKRGASPKRRPSVPHTAVRAKALAAAKARGRPDNRLSAMGGGLVGQGGGKRSTSLGAKAARKSREINPLINPRA